MNNYLLDTNHASWLMSKDPNISVRLQEAQKTGAQFGVPITVLGELYYAVYASQQRAENLHNLQVIIKTMLLWPFDILAAQEFGRIQAEQKAKGRPIPPLDAQIAAIARVNNLILLTEDRHLSFVGGIIIENWHIR